MCILLFKNWKINTLSSKLRKLSSLARELSFYTFLMKLFFVQFFNDKIHNYVLFAIIVHFEIQKLKINRLLYKLRKLDPLILTEREETKTKYFRPKVVYICSSNWLLAVKSRDSSQAEKKNVAKAEQIFNSDNYFHPKWHLLAILCEDNIIF